MAYNASSLPGTETLCKIAPNSRNLPWKSGATKMRTPERQRKNGGRPEKQRQEGRIGVRFPVNLPVFGMLTGMTFSLVLPVSGKANFKNH